MRQLGTVQYKRQNMGSKLGMEDRRRSMRQVQKTADGLRARYSRQEMDEPGTLYNSGIVNCIRYME